MKNLLLILLLPGVSFAQKKGEAADPTKRFLESSTEKILTATEAQRAKPPMDLRKGELELPTKKLVRAARTREALLAQLSQPNPPAKPGDVAWLPSFRAACAASQKSGKPVLLFHLMGKLDERFT